MDKMPQEWFDKNERLNDDRELAVGLVLIDPWGESSQISHLDGDGERGTIVTRDRFGKVHEYSMTNWQRNLRIRYLAGAKV